MAGIQVQAGSPPVPWHPPRIVRLPGPVTSASQGRSTVGQGQARPPSEGPGPTQSPAVTSLQAEVWPGNLRNTTSSPRSPALRESRMHPVGVPEIRAGPPRLHGRTGRPRPRVQSEQAEAHPRLGGLEPVGSLTASPWVSALSPRPHGKVTAPQTDRWLKGGAQARSASVQSWRFPGCTVSSWELSLPPLAAGQGGHLNVAQHLDLSKVTLDADADVTGP